MIPGKRTISRTGRTGLLLSSDGSISREATTAIFVATSGNLLGLSEQAFKGDVPIDEVRCDRQDVRLVLHGGQFVKDVQHLLYCFNSNAYSKLEDVKGYDYIRADQIAWYRAQSESFTRANGGIPIPSLAFFHIPFPEFNQASSDEHAHFCGTRMVDSYDEFRSEIEKGGFLAAHWDGTTETEERIKAETKATIRCIPLDRKAEKGVCMVTGRPSEGRVYSDRKSVV